MDIRDTIKNKVSKRLNELSKWDSKTAPNTYELDNFLRKSGYRLSDISIGDQEELQIIIDSKKESYLNPPILYNSSDSEFYVDIEAYDPVNFSDLEEIIKGYQNALGVLKHLDNINLEKIKEENV